MSRLLLFIIIIALVVAIVALLVTIAGRVLDAGRSAFEPRDEYSKEGRMVPTPFQQITYAALILLLLGIATGWLGGL